MISRLKHILNENSAAFPFIEQLESVFMTMDAQYGTISNQYGFNCNGCYDNCCFSLFYHHTLLECLYLWVGYNQLGNEEKRAMIHRAHQFNTHQQLVATQQTSSFRPICPLNVNDRCRLYAFRPMICRLHGIPYQLQTPGKKIIHGAGCNAFNLQCKEEPYRIFDRTPLYAVMAKLENEARQALVFNEKIKLTVAQILVLFE